MTTASTRNYYSRPNYRFLPSDYQQSLGQDSAGFELDESDLYDSIPTRSDSTEFRSCRVAKRPAAKRDYRAGGAATASSLPVNIPDWSKILREEYRDNRRRSESDDDDLEGDDWVEGGVRVPPHEYLARTKMASFSVHEGIGRTLKGRDLRMVRNVIFEKTGFED